MLYALIAPNTAMLVNRTTKQPSLMLSRLNKLNRSAMYWSQINIMIDTARVRPAIRTLKVRLSSAMPMATISYYVKNKSKLMFKFQFAY